MSNHKSRYNPDYALLIQAVQAARKEAGLSQAEIAKRMGITQSTWSKIETGERRLDVVEVRRFCSCIGIDFISFFQKLNDEMS